MRRKGKTALIRPASSEAGGHNNTQLKSPVPGDGSPAQRRRTATKGNTLNIGIKELLEAGVHFGHQTRRWNPKMKRFIFDLPCNRRNAEYAETLS